MRYKAPIIDHQVGIKCYCTDFGGVGGAIKQQTKDFYVVEIIDPSVLGKLTEHQDENHKFPLYVLEKSNIDSNHAVEKIKERYGIQLRVLGIKDAKADTLQYATTNKLKKFKREIRTSQVSLSFKGFTSRPISKSILLGNQFSIVIRTNQSMDAQQFKRELKHIANFYGLQRFGSRRAVTHLVGKEIVSRNFKRAVELLLSYTTHYDSEINKEIREKSQDPRNYPGLVRSMPKGMDIERHLMYAALDGKDDIVALRTIPINIRRLFVQAYQSYIFNLCLSEVLLAGQEILEGKQGDLCFEVEGPLKFGKVRRFDPTSDSEFNTVPAVSLVGYAYQAREGRFESVTTSLLKSEGIVSKDFYIKEMQELSTRGGYRQAQLCATNFSMDGIDPLAVSFSLPTGSYATTLLREIMKPLDPIKSGF